MITKREMGEIHDKTSVLQYLEESKFETVLDIGVSGSPWAGKYITHAIDIVEKNIAAPNLQAFFVGNISHPDVFVKVKERLVADGIDKVDFCICSHTLEDVNLPATALKAFSSIAKEGFIAVPSKYAELRRTNRPFRGWIHHRWMFDVLGGALWLAPKLSFIEHYLEGDPPIEAPNELRVFWKDEMPFRVLNDDYIGPSEEGIINTFLDFAGMPMGGLNLSSGKFVPGENPKKDGVSCLPSNIRGKTQ